MKIREYLAKSAQRLPPRISSPNLEVEVLIRHLLGMERSEFFASLERSLSQSQQKHLNQLIQRRVEGEPLAYIVGHREFYGLDFIINRHVLIPRQETELLVDKVLEFARSRPGESLKIADVGTGSGAIAISVAKNLPSALVYAIDSDSEALHVTRINSHRHGITGNLELLEGDLLKPLASPVDAIVSNPPYIPTQELARLSPEVKHEPVHALDGGADGLGLILRLLQQAPGKLSKGGCILIEIAPEQLGKVSEIAKKEFPHGEITIFKDLLGLPRVIVVKTDEAAF